jgi:membrane protein implicated in regulation of membrane protease activity
LLIKYIGPSLSIPATPTNALIIVLLPTIVMAIALVWRFQRRRTEIGV